MKRSELIFSAVLVPLDYVMLMVAIYAAYELRFESFLATLQPVLWSLPFGEYMGGGALIALGWLIIFALAGLYTIEGTVGRIAELKRIVLACSAAMTAVILFFFFNREFFSSRFVIITAWVLSILMVALGRSVARTMQYRLLTKGVGLHRLVLILPEDRQHPVETAIGDQVIFGYRVVATFRGFSAPMLSELEHILKAHGTDEVFLLNTELERAQIEQLLERCEYYHVGFCYATDLLGTRSTNLSVTTVAGIPMVEITRTPLDGWGRIFKRMFDIVVSASLLIILSPLFAIIAIIIRITSPGPIIYRNIRVRKEGDFLVYKFRTMYLQYCTGPGYSNGEAEAVEQQLIAQKSERKGPIYKVLNDPRRTPFGKLLERTSFDELPQLVNVLKGDMSLVGPRPHQPREVASYAATERAVLSLKPGVTGLAQVSGRSDLNFADEVRLDTYYIEHWSLWLDMTILFRTPFAVMRRRKRV